MTLYEFKSLSEDQQTELVWSEGDFVADRHESDCCILLYQIRSFYVELYYNGQANKLSKLRSFSSINQLEPYLNNIDILGISLI